MVEMINDKTIEVIVDSLDNSKKLIRTIGNDNKRLARIAIFNFLVKDNNILGLNKIFIKLPII